VSAAEPQPGHFPDRVGKYELLMPIGTGATATVFLARTRGVAGFEREVALKLVHAHLRADEESKLHLLDEARLAARIRHPNVVPVTEVESDPFGVFLVMDYVEGDSLSGLVRVLRERNQRLPPRLAARIMNDALAGLHAAHELRDPDGQLVGLVHRDFSPQNILVGIEGVTRLADFGVAKAASRAVRTKTGLVKGKIAYMSPEQARGHRLDRRCDVWAAGVVVWELITGRRLYEHEDEVATLLSIVTQDPPRLRDVIRGVPSAIEEAVSYALTSDLNARCPSAEALRSLLEAAWQDIGGMASTTEVAAFVRATVGAKLNERRAFAARPRPRSVASPDEGTLDAGQPSLRAPTAPLPRDEATKTAISAAVPAAALRSPVSVRRRLWRERALMIGGTVTLLSLGALALPLLTREAPGGAAPDTALGLHGADEGASAVAKPGTDPASQLPASKLPASKGALNAPEREGYATPLTSGSATTKGVASTVAAALSGSDRSPRASDEDDDESNQARTRSGSKSSARKGDATARKAAQQRKQRAKRTSTQSPTNEEAEVRGEKKPSRSPKANPNTPVRLAPDPYQLDN
jgi:tRNA A-37 threonylcarbamoyl transferase component Bud32